MQMLTSPSVSPTSTITRCPQCAAIMKIKLVEPDQKDSRKEWRVFECQWCGLPRTFMVERRKSPRLAGLVH
jgi:hypothetical protein